MYEELDNNREKDYAAAAMQGQLKHGQLMFLHHELTISRLHFMLEMACGKSGGQVELADWQQGSHLKAKVLVPAIKSSRAAGNDYLWSEGEGQERLPVGERQKVGGASGHHRLGRWLTQPPSSA